MTLDDPTAYVSANDDILQMITSLEAFDRDDTRMAGKLASGLTPDRRAYALSNLSRILVHLLQQSEGISKDEVYASLRESVLNRIVEDGISPTP